MGFSRHDTKRNEMMLSGSFAKKGYDWWWHSFTAVNQKTGKERPFFIEFFLCNPALSEDKPVLGQLKENKEKGKKPSYLMIKAGTWGEDKTQLHKFYSWKDIKVKPDAPYEISAENFLCSETALKGSIVLSISDAENHPEYMCSHGSISWDLTINKIIPFNVGYGAGSFFRALKAFQMYWHAEGMKSTYSGTITYNGENYEVKPESSYGYADKNWGSDFTTPWVWLSSNDLTSKITGKKLTNSVFDIGGGAPKVFGILLKRKLLSAFYYEGKEYEFNFSKFWTFTKTRFDCRETEDEIIWNVFQSTTGAAMETEVHCLKKDMLFVNYESPAGEKKHNRLWNGGNGTGTVKLYKKEHGKLKLIDEIKAGHVGCEYGEMDS